MKITREECGHGRRDAAKSTEIMYVFRGAEWISANEENKSAGEQPKCDYMKKLQPKPEQALFAVHTVPFSAQAPSAA